MNPTLKVLLASSSTTSGYLWGFRLLEKQFDLVTEPNQGRVVQRCLAESPDLLVLDLAVVDVKAIYLLHSLREQVQVPVLVLLASQNADQILKVYEAGADDCIIKPIEPRVFQAKITAWLRHSQVLKADMLGMLRVGSISLHPVERILSHEEEGISIHLTNTEARLLYVLMSHAGRVVPADEIIRLVWMHKGGYGKDTLKTAVHRLRAKLEAESIKLHCIVTVPGGGYKFVLNANPGPGGEGGLEGLGTHKL